ncbi:hypothetical protein QQ045_021110 [Rhodiola kirilowii]
MELARECRLGGMLSNVGAVADDDGSGGRAIAVLHAFGRLRHSRSSSLMDAIEIGLRKSYGNADIWGNKAAISIRHRRHMALRLICNILIRWLMLLMSSGSRLSKLLVLHRRFLPAEIQRMPLLLDHHLSQNMPAIKLYWSKVLHQVNMLLSAVKKYHLQLQDFVRQEM